MIDSLNNIPNIVGYHHESDHTNSKNESSSLPVLLDTTFPCFCQYVLYVFFRKFQKTNINKQKKCPQPKPERYPSSILNYLEHFL